MPRPCGQVGPFNPWVALHRPHQLVNLADDGMLVQSAYLIRPVKPLGGGVIHDPDPPQEILIDGAIPCRHCLDVCDCLV